MDPIRLTRRCALATLLGSAAASGPTWRSAAQAGAILRIALAAPNTTMDPHLQSNAPNNAVATHIFDSLVVNDHASRSVPGLAESWRILDDTHWEFTLRDALAFSDGTPLTWEDIAVSVARATVLPSTASFRTYTRTVKAITSAGGNKLIVETKAPDPLLLNSLSRIRIISKRFKDAPSAEFNAGPAAVGSGPYRLREFSPGNHVILVRNDKHWGPKAPWAEVQLRVMSDDGARTAALLSGAVDLVEELPAPSAERVQADARFHVVRGVSSRVVYFGMDHARETTPFAADNAGAPLPQNPFRDLRVRQAFAMAINRQAIVERVMDGNALAAAQYLPNGQPGTSDRIEPLPFDPVRAQALLAEAGYPRGFRLTLHGPNDRIINDAKIVQTVAQMLKRIGIETRVEVMPWTVYSGRSNRGEFSFFLGSWGVNTGETSNPMIALNATFNREAGTGASNAGRYSNAKLDELLRRATATLDDAARNRMLAEASEIVFGDVAVIPLHNEMLVLGARRGIAYQPRADQYTLAMGVMPSP